MEKNKNKKKMFIEKIRTAFFYLLFGVAIFGTSYALGYVKGYKEVNDKQYQEIYIKGIGK